MKNKFYSNQVSQVSDEDDISPSNNFCGYFKNQRVTTKLVIPLDEEFREARYYRMVVDAISDLGEDDVIEFRINSPGGDLDGLVALLHAIRSTDASTIAVLEGEVHSAASILAVSCDAVVVGPYSNMLCHSCRFSAGGKAADITSQVAHTAKYAEQIFRDAYEYFLTDDEINDILQGKELWLDNNEINMRFTRKYEALNALEGCEGCCGDPVHCDDICDCPLAEDE